MTNPFNDERWAVAVTFVMIMVWAAVMLYALARLLP